MVSNSCKVAVKEVLAKMELHIIHISLGEVEILEDISKQKMKRLETALQYTGLELIDDNQANLMEKIKILIIEIVHYSGENTKIINSNFISEKLHYNYTYLANAFSETQGITIEKFIISHKVERIKELIMYDELKISEIAAKMNYSSASHMSSQFKKSTGITPSNFKLLKERKRRSLEDI